jgi:hypothetical protein
VASGVSGDPDSLLQSSSCSFRVSFCFLGVDLCLYYSFDRLLVKQQQNGSSRRVLLLYLRLAVSDFDVKAAGVPSDDLLGGVPVDRTFAPDDAYTSLPGSA